MNTCAAVLHLVQEMRFVVGRSGGAEPAGRTPPSPPSGWRKPRAAGARPPGGQGRDRRARSARSNRATRRPGLLTLRPIRQLPAEDCARTEALSIHISSHQRLLSDDLLYFVRVWLTYTGSGRSNACVSVVGRVIIWVQ